MMVGRKDRVHFLKRSVNSCLSISSWNVPLPGISAEWEFIFESIDSKGMLFAIMI